MPFLPAQRISLDGKATFRGSTLVTRGNMEEKIIRSFEELVLNDGRKRKFAKDAGYQFTVPVLAPFATLLPFYQTWASLRFGQAIAPEPKVVATLSLTTTNTLNFATAHGYTTADPVQVSWDGSAPTTTPALSRSTTYYVRAVDSDSVSLHTSASDASSNTAPITLTAAGTGNLWLWQQRSLTINTRDNLQRVFNNAVPIELPDLVFNGSQLLWEGNLVFHCFPKLGADPSSGSYDQFYTGSAVSYTTPTWGGDETLTTPTVTAAWADGGIPTLTSFRAEKGLRVSFKPELEPMDDGVYPAQTMILKGFAVQAKGIPIGMTATEFRDAFLPAVGAQLEGANLVLGATGISLTLYDAQLDLDGLAEYGADAPLVKELTWTAMGNSTSGNKPPFLLATA